jgi:hypothetical protein
MNVHKFRGGEGAERVSPKKTNPAENRFSRNISFKKMILHGKMTVKEAFWSILGL